MQGGISVFRRLICMALCGALLLGLLSGCRSGNDSSAQAEPFTLRAAVLYSGGEAWKDTVYDLEQSPMLGLSVQAQQVSSTPELSSYDILYLDESLLADAPAGFTESVCAFTKAGGAVFLPNGFCEVFPEDYLGISGTVKLTGFCTEPEYPLCSTDVGEIQQIIRDYAGLYARYTDFQFLSGQDYGFGVIPDTAQALAFWDGAAVYTLNRYGGGYVFLTNPMLPSVYSTGSRTMELTEGKSNFASSTASFNQLLLCGFAEYVAKQTHGYALERVYGYFGTPSMAWELHYEEITGIAADALQIFSELCVEYDQVPSYTLIRNSYTWFLRAESVTFLLNQADSGFVFQMDLDESAYSSGTHIDAGGEWLTLRSIEKGGSYFEDYPEHTLRAYPQAVDLNGDGMTDILCGSSDGLVYFFEGTGFYDGRLHTNEPRVLTAPDGSPICGGGFSAPQTADLNGDGFPDLICGWDDGAVRWFSGDENLNFEYRDVLAETGSNGQALPAFGDVNGDAVPDLLVGSDQGTLLLYPGQKDTNTFAQPIDLSPLCADAGLGSWLAPTVTDWNQDGTADLAVGTFDGYIALFPGDGNSGFRFDGYLTAEEMNYKGNNNLKFGNWAAPSFADLDGDGQEDLLCGSLEYGIAYPIDSEYFPHRQKLQEQVDYALERDYYMGIHFYTNAYASAAREAYELQAHREAMASYGLDTSKVGVNQHTWYTSSLSGAQTMSSIGKAGLLWQSGFAAPGSRATAPQVAAENVVALPFFLMEDGEPTVLVQNNAVLLYNDEQDNALSARYGMPVCIFYHCDFAYLSEDPARQVLQMAQEFREKYGYNFNREDQLIQAAACALQQEVAVSGTLEDSAGVTISTVQPSTDFALNDEAVNQSLGVRVVFSEDINTEQIQPDADIWYWDGRTLVLGLNREAGFSIGPPASDQPHLRRINMAADISMTETGAAIQFLSGGMMEASVEGAATTDSPGWKVIQRDNETIFIKFGSNESLNLIFQEVTNE